MPGRGFFYVSPILWHFRESAGSRCQNRASGCWSELIQFGASFADPPTANAPLPPVSVTWPDGTDLVGGRDDLDAEVSKILGREVTLTSIRPEAVSIDRLDPLAEDKSIVDIGAFMMNGWFADYAAFHLVSTASLAKLAELCPDAQFDMRRFRPNIVVATPDDQTGFVENDWVGRIIKLERRCVCA